MKPLRNQNNQAQLLAEAMKAAEAIEQTNKADDQLTNSDSKKGNSLKPVQPADIADHDINDEDDSDDNPPTNLRPFQ